MRLPRLRQLIHKYKAEPIDQDSFNSIQDHHFVEGMDRSEDGRKKLVERVCGRVHLQNMPLVQNSLNEVCNRRQRNHLSVDRSNLKKARHKVVMREIITKFSAKFVTIVLHVRSLPPSGFVRALFESKFETTYPH